PVGIGQVADDPALVSALGVGRKASHCYKCIDGFGFKEAYWVDTSRDEVRYGFVNFFVFGFRQGFKAFKKPLLTCIGGTFFPRPVGLWFRFQFWLRLRFWLRIGFLKNRQRRLFARAFRRHDRLHYLEHLTYFSKLILHQPLISRHYLDSSW